MQRSPLPLRAQPKDAALSKHRRLLLCRGKVTAPVYVFEKLHTTCLLPILVPPQQTACSLHAHRSVRNPAAYPPCPGSVCFGWSSLSSWASVGWSLAVCVRDSSSSRPSTTEMLNTPPACVRACVLRERERERDVGLDRGECEEAAGYLSSAPFHPLLTVA